MQHDFEDFLEGYGWDSQFQHAWQELNQEVEASQSWEPGRETVAHKHLYRVMTRHGELLADVSGRFRYVAAGTGDFPAVGDWVALQARPSEQRGTIYSVCYQEEAYFPEKLRETAAKSK